MQKSIKKNLVPGRSSRSLVISIRGTEFLVQVSGRRLQVQVVGHRSQVTGRRLQVAGRGSRVVSIGGEGHWERPPGV